MDRRKTTNFEEFNAIFNNNETEKFTEVLTAIKLILVHSIPTANTKLPEAHVEIWLKKVLPLIFDDNEKLQSSALYAIEAFLPHLLKSEYRKIQYWEKCRQYLVEDFINHLNNCFDNYTFWGNAWRIGITLLDIELLDNKKYMNKYLLVVQNAFRSVLVDKRQNSFDCWAALIQLYIRHNYLSMKRLKLLTIPIRSVRAKTVEIAEHKFRIMWNLIQEQKSIADEEVNNEIFEMFFLYCFNISAKKSNFDMKNEDDRDYFWELHKIYNKILLLFSIGLIGMVGEPNMDVKSLGSHNSIGWSKNQLISQHTFAMYYKTLINASFEATVLSGKLTDVNTITLCKNIWYNIIGRIDISENDDQFIYLTETIGDFNTCKLDYFKASEEIISKILFRLCAKIYDKTDRTHIRVNHVVKCIIKLNIVFPNYKRIIADCLHAGRILRTNNSLADYIQIVDILLENDENLNMKYKLEIWLRVSDLLTKTLNKNMVADPEAIRKTGLVLKYGISNINHVELNDILMPWKALFTATASRLACNEAFNLMSDHILECYENNKCANNLFTIHICLKLFNFVQYNYTDTNIPKFGLIKTVLSSILKLDDVPLTMKCMTAFCNILITAMSTITLGKFICLINEFHAIFDIISHKVSLEKMKKLEMIFAERFTSSEMDKLLSAEAKNTQKTFISIMRHFESPKLKSFIKRFQPTPALLKDTDFVEIPKSTNELNADVLTNHQKEKRKEKTFIPALYNDLTQSCESSTMKQLKEPEVIEPKALNNTKVSDVIEPRAVNNTQARKSTLDDTLETSVQNTSTICKDKENNSLNKKTVTLIISKPLNKTLSSTEKNKLAIACKRELDKLKINTVAGQTINSLMKLPRTRSSSSRRDSYDPNKDTSNIQLDPVNNKEIAGNIDEVAKENKETANLETESAKPPIVLKIMTNRTATFVSSEVSPPNNTSTNNSLLTVPSASEEFPKSEENIILKKSPRKLLNFDDPGMVWVPVSNLTNNLSEEVIESSQPIVNKRPMQIRCRNVEEMKVRLSNAEPDKIADKPKKRQSTNEEIVSRYEKYLSPHKAVVVLNKLDVSLVNAKISEMDTEANNFLDLNHSTGAPITEAEKTDLNEGKSTEKEELSTTLASNDNESVQKKSTQPSPKKRRSESLVQTEKSTVDLSPPIQNEANAVDKNVCSTNESTTESVPPGNLLRKKLSKVSTLDVSPNQRHAQINAVGGPTNTDSPTSGRSNQLMSLMFNNSPKTIKKIKPAASVTDNTLLVFERALPSPCDKASGGSILKRRARTDDSIIDESEMHAAKRKRVSFNDPPVTCKKEYQINDEEKRGPTDLVGFKISSKKITLNRIDSIHEITDCATSTPNKNGPDVCPVNDNDLSMMDMSDLQVSAISVDNSNCIIDVDEYDELISLNAQKNKDSLSFANEEEMLKYVRNKYGNNISKKNDIELLEELIEKHPSESIKFAVQENSAKSVCELISMNTLIEYLFENVGKLKDTAAESSAMTNAENNNKIRDTLISKIESFLLNENNYSRDSLISLVMKQQTSKINKDLLHEFIKYVSSNNVNNSDIHNHICINLLPKLIRPDV